MTSSLKNQLVLAPFARGLLYDDTETENRYTPILTTSEGAFSRSEVSESTTFEKEEGDVDGPFAVALKVEKPAADGEISTVYAVGERVFLPRLRIIGYRAIISNFLRA